jgi:2-polyprenyl-3-methyl-5-hydroxy-6-metoxy-1,4-benzoquinol methylase
MEFALLDNDIENVCECQVCGSKNFNLVSVAEAKATNFLETSVCNECGLFFRSKRPVLNWLVECWEKRDNQQRKKGVLPIDSTVESNRIQRYLSLEKLLVNYTDEKKILDVGSGTGGGLRAFKENGWDVLGIEPDVSRARYGVDNFGINTLVETIEKAVVKDKFPIVTMIHSLEHFYDPIEKIKIVSGFVKEGGYIYIEVPDALTHVLDWSDGFFLGHLSNFMEHNLALLGSNLGLTPVLRTYPKSKHYGVENLGILFRKNNIINSSKKFPEYSRQLSKDISRVVDRYHSNRKIKNGIIHISIPEVNDLSIGYKDSSIQNNFNIDSNSCLVRNENGNYSVVKCSNNVKLILEKIKTFSFRVLYIHLSNNIKKFFNKEDSNFLNIRYIKY